MNNIMAADAYKRNSVLNADQKRLILICYNEAINSLKFGIEYYMKKDFEKKCNQFKRAKDFISELQASLNIETGDTIAENLSKIYTFMLKHIMEGDARENIKAIEDVIDMLSELKSAWEQLPMTPEVQPVIAPETQKTAYAYIG